MRWSAPHPANAFSNLDYWQTASYTSTDTDGPDVLVSGDLSAPPRRTPTRKSRSAWCTLPAASTLSSGAPRRRSPASQHARTGTEIPLLYGRARSLPARQTMRLECDGEQHPRWSRRGTTSSSAFETTEPASSNYRSARRSCRSGECPFSRCSRPPQSQRIA